MTLAAGGVGVVLGALENPQLHSTVHSWHVVVDLFDAKTKNLVWRGVSSGVLSDKSDKNIKNLNRGVR